MHVFHDPLANGGGGINRRCSVEESSAISPVLEKMEEQVYTTKHLVSYRTILSMEANHHEANNSLLSCSFHSSMFLLFLKCVGETVCLCGRGRTKTQGKRMIELRK